MLIVLWYAGNCRIIDLDLHYNAITMPYLIEIKYMTYYIMILRFKPTSAQPRNFRIIPQNCTEIFSAEFCGIP